MNRKGLFILIACVVLTASGSVGADRIRPTRAEELQLETVAEVSEWVEGAEIAYIDGDALRADFEELAHYSDEDLKTLMLENFNYITGRQKRLIGIRNSNFKTNPARTKLKFRPPGSTRSTNMELVIEVNGKRIVIGMVNLKGDGQGSDAEVEAQVIEYHLSQGPAERDKLYALDHSDGLMSLGENVAEITRQGAVQRGADFKNARTGGDMQTAKTYFSIRWPFGILKPGGVQESTAVYGRQATFDRLSRGGTIEDLDVFDGAPELTAFGGVIDFGLVKPTFAPLRHNFVTEPGENITANGKAWDWGHQAAHAYDQGDKGAIVRHVHEMLDPVEALWKALPKVVPDRFDDLEYADIRTGNLLSARTVNGLDFYVQKNDRRASVFFGLMSFAQFRDYLWRSAPGLRNLVFAYVIQSTHLTPAMWRMLLPHVRTYAGALILAKQAFLLGAYRADFRARAELQRAFFARAATPLTRLAIAQAYLEAKLEGKEYFVAAAEPLPPEMASTIEPLAREALLNGDPALQLAALEILSAMTTLDPTSRLALQTALNHPGVSQSVKAKLALGLIRNGMVNSELLEHATDADDLAHAMTALGKNVSRLSGAMVEKMLTRNYGHVSPLFPALLDVPTFTPKSRAVLLGAANKALSFEPRVYAEDFLRRWRAALVVVSHPGDFDLEARNQVLAFLREYSHALYNVELLRLTERVLSQGDEPMRALLTVVRQSEPYAYFRQPVPTATQGWRCGRSLNGGRL